MNKNFNLNASIVKEFNPSNIKDVLDDNAFAAKDMLVGLKDNELKATDRDKF